MSGPFARHLLLGTHHFFVLLTCHRYCNHLVCNTAALPNLRPSVIVEYRCGLCPRCRCRGAFVAGNWRSTSLGKASSSIENETGRRLMLISSGRNWRNGERRPDDFSPSVSSWLRTVGTVQAGRPRRDCVRSFEAASPHRPRNCSNSLDCYWPHRANSSNPDACVVHSCPPSSDNSADRRACGLNPRGKIDFQQDEGAHDLCHHS